MLSLYYQSKAKIQQTLTSVMLKSKILVHVRWYWGKTQVKHVKLLHVAKQNYANFLQET